MWFYATAYISLNTKMLGDVSCNKLCSMIFISETCLNAGVDLDSVIQGHEEPEWRNET